MRTKHSIYNLLVNVLSSLIVPVLGFIKVRLFVDLYGSELNGMQLVLMQFITFLNIFELAYSLAFRQLLYKPLSEKNRQKVLEIYWGAKKIFMATGWFLLVVGGIAGFVIPYFINSDISSWEIIISYFILFMPFALSYFLMGPNFVIAADQQEYKISIWIQGIAIVRMIVMIGVILLQLPYILIFIVEGCQILLSNVIARQVALKNYPWLNEKKESVDGLFAHNIRYTLSHRLAQITNANTDNLIIQAFFGLELVSVFGAYSYLAEAINKVVNSIVTSPINSFGNLFNDTKRDVYAVFTEFYNFSTYIGTVIAICVFVVMNRLVLIWMGQDLYVLNNVASFLLALNMFYLTQREPLLVARDTNGLFKKAVLNAYLIAIVKIVLSILLIRRYRIVGILFATAISYWVVDFLYTPFLVYRHVFHLDARRYYKMVVLRVFVMVGVGVLAYFGWSSFTWYTDTSILHFLLGCMILGLCVFVVVTILYWLLFKSFRNLLLRLKMAFRKEPDHD